MIDEISIHIRHQAVRSSLDERGRRLQAVAKAISAGHGGVAAAAGATKVARSTIGRGIKDLHEPATLTVIQPSATEFLRDIARDPIQRRATYYSWLATFCQSSEFSTFGFYIPVLFVILGVSSLVGTNVILLFVWLFGTLAAWVAPLMIPRVGHKGIGEIGFGCVLTALLIAAYALYTAAVGQANATLTVAIFPLAGLLGAIFLLVGGGQNPRKSGGVRKIGIPFASRAPASPWRRSIRSQRLPDSPLSTPQAAEGGGRRPAFTGGWQAVDPQ